MNERAKRNMITIAGSECETLRGSDLVDLACGRAGCPTNCCTSGPPIVLNPYEIDRLCRAAGISYEDLLDIVETERAGGYPLVMLPRDPACHFWTAQGCRIYADRPLACRLFPLGRVFENGSSHIVLPGRNRCPGLEPSPSRTLEEYLHGQGAGTFVDMADLWISFVSDMEALGLPDREVTSVAFHMLVYSPDTPPSDGMRPLPETAEDRFQLRIATARRMLPRFLKVRSDDGIY